MEQTLANLAEQLAEERRAIEAGERTRNNGTADRTREISLINTITTTRAIGADDIRAIREGGVPNNFTWLRTKSLRVRSRNIEDLQGQVNVIFGPVNRDGDDSNYNSQEENNLYFTRTKLGGSEGFTKQSIITQVIKPQYVDRQAAEEFGNDVSDNEFLIYQRRLARQMASVR